MTEEIKKNSKLLKNINYSDDENDFESDVETDAETKDMIDHDYYIDVVTTLQKNLINYVEHHSVPICEYLSFDKVEIFLNNIFNS